MKRLLYALWPPYEAYEVNSYVRAKRTATADGFWSHQYGVYRTLVHSFGDAEKLKTLAALVRENEVKRRESIESKAAQLVVAIAIALTVFTALPGFYDKWQLSVWLLLPFGAAILHLLVSAYYAARVRLVKGLVIPGAE